MDECEEDPGLEETLRAIASFFIPLPEDERRVRERIYRESGQIDPETIMRVLSGESS